MSDARARLGLGSTAGNLAADPAVGYAIRQGDKILVETVFETMRGAMVNWLAVYTPDRPKRWDSEQDIAQRFKSMAPEGVQLIPVRIEHDAG